VPENETGEEVATMSTSAKTCEKGRDPKTCSPEQIEECHGAEAGHACLSEQEGWILAEVRQSMGFVPGPLVVMSKRPGVLSKFMAYGNRLFEGGPLTDRERFLIALSAAAALKSPNCIRAHSRRAQEAGATTEEVLQTLLIAGMISNTSALHVAYESAGLFGDGDAEA
jgi:AhpD family alkylhydroperoxidase